jgi:NAD(P)-dependent dehydrogenase (short-subunit alcohol dehydrogenase family)
MEKLFSLEGKKVLVTGASSGIGKSIAITASAHGAQLIITGKNQERLQKTFACLKKTAAHQKFACDLTSLEELDSLVNSCDSIDGLVLNAGTVKLAPIAFINDAMLDQLFEVNIKSSIRIVQRLIRKKKINKGASIIFTSSIATIKTTIGNSVYNATKGAVNSFVKSLALELAKNKIRANAILPGFVPTNIVNSSKSSLSDWDAHLKSYPLGRYGSPEDVAYLSIYLLCDQSQWMTGSLINLDGGFSLK